MYRFFVGEFQVTIKEIGSVYGGETYFGSDPKEEHKSDLQSPFEIHNEVEDKSPLLGCEPESLVEEKDTIAILHEEDEDEIPRYDVISDFFKDHIHCNPQSYPPLHTMEVILQNILMLTCVLGMRYVLWIHAIRKMTLCVSHWKERIWWRIFFMSHII